MAFSYSFVLPPTGKAENAQVREMFDDIKAFFDQGLPGSGTVNSALANKLAYYATTGTAVSGLAFGTADQWLSMNHAATATEWKTPYYINVKDYGAVGNGSTDDTTSIQAALTAASSANANVLFPKGSYKITDTLNITGSCTVTGYEATITQFTSAKGGFYITASNVEIRGLTLVGKQHATANIPEVAIQCSGPNYAGKITDIGIYDCTIHNWGEQGIRFDYANRCKVLNNHVYDIVYSGIQGRHTNYCDFSHNLVHDIGPGDGGVEVGIVLTGNDSQNEIPYLNTISNNRVYNLLDVFGQGILIEAAEATTITGNVVIDCGLGICVETSINHIISLNNTVSGNSIINKSLTTLSQRKAGILMVGDSASFPSLNNTISGNTIVGYGTNTPSTYGAIHLVWNTRSCITGNNILDSSCVGIYLVEREVQSLISGNNIDGIAATGADAGIRITNGNDTNTFIDSNKINVGTAVGIAFDVSDPDLMVGNNFINTSLISFKDVYQTSPTITPLTASTAVYADSNKTLASSSTTSTELGYVHGVTSAIQTQLDAKSANTEAFVTIGNTSGLTSERALTGTSNQIIVTDNGANSTVVLSTPQNLHTAATPTFASETLTATSNQLVLGTTRTVTLTAPTPTTSSRTYTFPDQSADYSIVATEGSQTINGSKTFSADTNINATKKLYLDGGGNSYLVESSGDVIDINTGGSLALRADSAQDIYTVAYTDYSGTSTIVGWASFTTKQIYYKKIGKKVFVNFELTGTSNSTSVTFTLPYTNSNTVYHYLPFMAVDNGGAAVFARLELPNNSATATLYSTVGAAAWTNTGTKACRGQFFYETT